MNNHRDAHGDLSRASDHMPYVPPNEHTRVSRLLKSIQTGDQRVIAAITHILGNPPLRDNFEAAADFLNLAAPPKKPTAASQTISAVDQEDDTVILPNKGTTGVELRYHGQDEYPNLTAPQKNELRQWRESQKGKKKGKDKSKVKGKRKDEGGNNRNNDRYKKKKSTIAALQTDMKEMRDLIKEQSQSIAALTSSRPNTDQEQTSNRNNDALRRPTQREN